MTNAKRINEITTKICFVGWLVVFVGAEYYYKHNCRGLSYVIFGSHNIVCRNIEIYQKPFFTGGFGLFGYFTKKYAKTAINYLVSYCF